MRAKDIRGKGVVRVSSANFVQKNNSHKNKKKPPLNQSKAKPTTTFKKKKKGACYVCASTEHFAAKCPNRKGNDSANMVISEPGGTSGYFSNLFTLFCEEHGIIHQRIFPYSPQLNGLPKERTAL